MKKSAGFLRSKSNSSTKSKKPRRFSFHIQYHGNKDSEESQYKSKTVQLDLKFIAANCPFRNPPVYISSNSDGQLTTYDPLTYEMDYLNSLQEYLTDNVDSSAVVECTKPVYYLHWQSRLLSRSQVSYLTKMLNKLTTSYAVLQSENTTQRDRIRDLEDLLQKQSSVNRSSIVRQSIVTDNKNDVLSSAFQLLSKGKQRNNREYVTSLETEIAKLAKMNETKDIEIEEYEHTLAQMTVKLDLQYHLNDTKDKRIADLEAHVTSLKKCMENANPDADMVNKLKVERDKYKNDYLETFYLYNSLVQDTENLQVSATQKLAMSQKRENITQKKLAECQLEIRKVNEKYKSELAHQEYEIERLRRDLDYHKAVNVKTNIYNVKDVGQSKDIIRDLDRLLKSRLAVRLEQDKENICETDTEKALQRLQKQYDELATAVDELPALKTEGDEALVIMSGIDNYEIETKKQELLQAMKQVDLLQNELSQTEQEWKKKSEEKEKQITELNKIIGESDEYIDELVKELEKAGIKI